jgi:membrane-associated phospholipid phosphatase
MLPGTGWTCCAGVIAMTTSAAGEPAPSAGAGRAGGVRNRGRWLTGWWFQALRRLRLAAALAAAALLKVSLEAAAKTVVQRDRPAETLHDVILRGKAAAHGLSFPSGHAMVIFAIATLAAPTSKAGGRPCPGPWPPRSACPVSTSARTSRWTSSRGRAWARSSGAC